MENAAYLTEPKIDTSPEALDKLANHCTEYATILILQHGVVAAIDCVERVFRAVASEKRRDAEMVRELVEALEKVHKIISEASPIGFDPTSGDWAERLFFSQRATNAALAKARAQGKKP